MWGQKARKVAMLLVTSYFWPSASEVAGQRIASIYSLAIVHLYIHSAVYYCWLPPGQRSLRKLWWLEECGYSLLSVSICWILQGIWPTSSHLVLTTSQLGSCYPVCQRGRRVSKRPETLPTVTPSRKLSSYLNIKQMFFSGCVCG